MQHVYFHGCYPSFARVCATRWNVHRRWHAGDKQIRAADKLTQPSILAMRLKADWDQATPLYEKAALNYKVGP